MQNQRTDKNAKAILIFFFGAFMDKRWTQHSQVHEDAVIIKNVLKIRSLVPETREARAAVW